MTLMRKEDLSIYWFKLLINDYLLELFADDPNLNPSDFIIVDREDLHLRTNQHTILIYEDFPQGDKMYSNGDDYFSIVTQYNVRIQMSRRIMNVNQDESYAYRIITSMYNDLNGVSMPRYNFPQVVGYSTPRKIGVDLDESGIYDISFRCLFHKPRTIINGR